MRADACAAKRGACQLAWKWRFPSHPRREKAAVAPEVPEYEAPIAQGEEAGEAEAEEREEGGSAQAAMDTGE